MVPLVAVRHPYAGDDHARDRGCPASHPPTCLQEVAATRPATAGDKDHGIRVESPQLGVGDSEHGGRVYDDLFVPSPQAPQHFAQAPIGQGFVRTAEDRERPGEERSLALLYQGEDAVEKAREQLGATDPRVARPGTVRSDFGADLMRNGAHASDSPQSAERERRVLGLWKEEGPADVRLLIEAYLRPGATSPGAEPAAKSRR